MKAKLSKWFSSLFEESGPPSVLIGVWTVILIGLGLWWCSKIDGLAAEEVRGAAFGSIALACFASITGGFFVGFLFGIPRVLQGADSAGDADKSKRGYEQRVNTNLEQISDWLTKIIVGVGLVELKDAPQFIWHIASRMSQSFSKTGLSNPSATPVICSAVLFFSVLGIVFGYLITRLYFASAFHQADQRANIVRGFDSGTLDAKDVPISQISLRAVPPPLSDGAKRILATLGKYQKEHCGNDANKRWTFVILPGAPAYTEYVKALGELLDAGLVVVSPENNHVMLSASGLKYVTEHADDIAGVAPYTF